jgi:arylsulfatase
MIKKNMQAGELKLRKNAVLAIGMIVGLGIAVFACVLAYSGTFKRKPDIILITCDALRADHLGCYGYKRMTSPVIDRLASDGALFLNCFSTSCSTLHAIPALISGRYLAVSELDVFNGESCNIIDGRFTLLAEYLKNSGYQTAAFVCNDFVRQGTGFEHGFDVFKMCVGSSGTVTDKIIDFLNRYNRAKPYFIWVHYCDTHVPYFSPAEFSAVFKNDRFYNENNAVLAVDLVPRGTYPKDGSISRKAFHKGEFSSNYYTALYDAAIRHNDSQIGRLLTHVDDNTVIIVTADHGESLGEHNKYFHHISMYDEVLRIPLIIRDNGYFKGGKKIPVLVSSVDIVPTILNRINPFWYFFVKNRFDGIDLARAAGSPPNRKYIYSYFPGIRCIRDVKKNIKYMIFPDDKEALYRIPDEENNLINDDSLRDEKQELKRSLRAWLKEYPVNVDGNRRKCALVEQAQENLRSMGYIQ